MLLGLVSGIGYLIRPECLQVVIYAFVWLVIVLLRDKIRANKIKIAYSLMALLFGIAVPMGICTTIKGSKIMPAKLKKVLQTSAVAERTIQDGSAEHPVKEIINGAAKLTNRIGENLMWFFLPAFLLGIGKFYAVKAGKLDIKKSFITFFLAFNVISLLLLYCNYGYISRRHCLPLVVFTIFYIPAGIEITVRLLNEKLLKRLHLRKSGIYAAVLLIGLGICLPKLLKPLHHNKKAYRQASEWLRQNTTSDDVISVPDKRITFYADRKGRSDKGRNFRSDSRYFVKIAKGGNEIIPDEGIIKQAEFNLSKKNAKIIIYSN